MGFALPMIMVTTSFLAWLDSWRGSCVRQWQNRHIVVKVAGRDCLLSPILVGYQAVLKACAGQFEQHQNDIYEIAAD